MAKRPSHFQPLVVRRRMCSFYLCLSLSRVASYASHENKMGTLLKSIEKDEATRALAGKKSQMLTHARYNSALDDAVTETRQTPREGEKLDRYCGGARPFKFQLIARPTDRATDRRCSLM